MKAYDSLITKVTHKSW